MKRNHLISSVIMIFLAAVFMFGCSFSGAPASVIPVVGNREIFINEVVSSNGSSLLAERYGSSDWLELYNSTGSDINLEGYTLVRNDSPEKFYTFPSVVLQSGEYMVILCNESNIESDEYIISGFNLPKEGSVLVLKDADGAVVDSVQVPALDTDISYCIYEGQYKYCVTPTPGSVNGGLMFDDIESVYDSEDTEALVINEANQDFVEIYNRSDHNVRLALYCLSDDESNLSKYRLPDIELGPGNYHLVDLNSSEVSFSMNEYESCIFLSCGGVVCDRIDIYGVVGGGSAGKLSDGTTVYFVVATPGEENSSNYLDSLSISDMDESSPVRISEILLNNSNSFIDENGDRPKWVELHNYSSEPVLLGSYYLSDDDGNLFRWQLPDTELGPDEYMVFCLTGNDTETHTNFRVSEGEPLILTDMNLSQSQTVMFPDESRLPDISYGEKDGAWLFFGRPTPGRANSSAGSESITNAEKLDKTQAYISEVSAVSAVRSGTRDWIELYNPSETAVALDGVYLSDDDTDLKKYALSGTMEPHAYIVVEASSKVKEQGEGVAPFSISSSGETLYLTDDIGAVLDSMETGVLGYSYTSGRTNESTSGERVFFSEPTKGFPNAGEIKAKLNAPVFSVDGGVIEETSVSLELMGDGNIYYTLDGSVPDSTSALYTSPISISSSTSVSAVCLKDGCIASDVVSQTYLFVEPHTVPVVCISISQGDLGAVSSSVDKKSVIERRCYVEYYDGSGDPGTAFPAGLRIGGAGTRGYSQKTFQIYLRGGYGQSSVVYPFFDNYPITEFKSLVLRNEGQDNAKTRMRDNFSGMLFDFMNIDNAQGRFVAVYINGNYWGVYDLKENQNEDYFASRTGLDAGQITTIRRNTMALSGSNSQIVDAYSKARSWNMADDENYSKFSELVDVDCFIDHIIARGYTADFDMFNQKYAYSDDYIMKIRPTFYDCDFSFPSVHGNVISKYFTGDGVPSQDGTFSNMYIPTALKRNASWCDRFIIRASEVMKVLPQRSLDLFDEMYEELKPEMQRHIARWHTPSSYSAWESNMRNLRSILEQRPKAFLSELKGCFSVSDERMHELFPEYY